MGLDTPNGSNPEIPESQQNSASTNLEKTLGMQEIIKNLKESINIKDGKCLKKKNGKYIVDEPKDKSTENLISQGQFIHCKLKGLNFKSFISNGEESYIDKEYFDTKNLGDISFSMEEISFILGKIRELLNDNGIKIDEGMDYNLDLIGQKDKIKCTAGEIMGKLLNLEDGNYRLKDIDEEGNRIKLVFFKNHSCHFQKSKKNYVKAGIIAKLAPFRRK